MKDASATKKALENIAKAMASLELEKIKGYKQSKEMKGAPDELKDDEEDDLVKVLEARKES